VKILNQDYKLKNKLIFIFIRYQKGLSITRFI